MTDASRKGRVVNLIGKNSGEETVKGERRSVKVEEKSQAMDPKVVQFNSKNGPETFTITHKT